MLVTRETGQFLELYLDTLNILFYLRILFYIILTLFPFFMRIRLNTVGKNLEINMSNNARTFYRLIKIDTKKI